MRHHNKNRKFGRTTNQRHALMKSLACSLIRDERINTTEAKAKEIRPFIEKIVTHGKTDTVSSRRFISSKIGSEELANKLVSEISTKYADRNGGYTRIIKLPLRKTDASKMARIEFV
jgi:large subunit ribosomal protein L17